MKNTAYRLVVIFLFLATACTQGQDGTNVLSKSQEAVQEKADAVIQPRIRAIEKAKALEDKLNRIENQRLEDIRGFDDNGK